MRTAVVSAVTCLALAGTTLAADVQAAIRKHTEIAEQQLGDALRAFAQDRGLQLIYLSDTVESLRAPGVVGDLTPDEVLKRLLSGTGLAYRYVDERTVSIFPARRSALPRAVTGSPGVAAVRGGQNAFGSSVWDRLRLAQLDQGTVQPGVTNTAGTSEEQRAASRAIEEIVVTAQKREELLKDVPISISVLDGRQLDASTSQGLTEALRRVPGVGINETYQGGGTQVAIRGITAGGALFNGSSPVSYYLDSVPFGLVRQAIGPDLNAYDLKRVEVLRGPQGTLYGASAQNGVVRVLTQDADANELTFKARTSGSSTKDGGENYRGDFAVNVPIVEGKLAVRAVAGYQDLGGWIDRPNKEDANDAEIRNMRLKVQAQPTDDLSVGLSAWLSRADYGMPSIADDEGRHRALNDEPATTDFDAYGVKIGYEFPLFSATSQTSYLEYANDSVLDATALGVVNRLARTTLDSEVFSQEVILNSTHGGGWRWTIGGIYRDAEDRQFQDSRINGVLFGAGVLDQTYISKSFAVFGELTRLFFDGQLELTGGLRYFEDEVTGREDARLTGAPASQLMRSRDKFDAVSPRVVLTWHVADSATLYTSYAEGFRSGFSQSGSLLSTAPQFPPLDADTLHNYELGAKGYLAGGRLEYEAAVYYIDWQDVQQSLVVPITGTAGVATALINGDSASGMGVDLGLVGRPSDALQLGINYSWNDVTLDSDVFSFVTPTRPVLLFAAGDRLNISAETTISGFGDYSFGLGGSGLTGTVSASVNYTSAMDLRTIVSGVQRIAKGDPILIGRTSFAVAAPAGWTATLFVDNVSNEQGSPTRYPFSALVTDWNSHVRPRTVGLQLEFVFK